MNKKKKILLGDIPRNSKKHKHHICEFGSDTAWRMVFDLRSMILYFLFYFI